MLEGEERKKIGETLRDLKYKQKKEERNYLS